MQGAAASSFTMSTGGNAAAPAMDFDGLVNLYRPKVFRFVLASIRDRDAAETITQDCFVRAWRAQEKFRGECRQDTWLMRIAVNLVRDHVRNRRLQFWKRSQSKGDPNEELNRLTDLGDRSAETRTILKQQVHAVWQAAAELPERQRTVFLLRFVEDMDLLEIAAVTQLSEGTVKTHLFRALQAVRERLGAQGQ